MGEPAMPYTSLENISRVGTVLSYDRDQDVFAVCIGPRRILIERSQIMRVIFQVNTDSYYDAPDSRCVNPHGGGDSGFSSYEEDPTLPYRIPDSSLEWQILHELVRREA